MSSSETTGNTANTAYGQSIAESDAELLRKLKCDFEFQREFEIYLQRNGGQLDKYIHRWLRDSYGRVFGGEEQWQFHIDQLREFIQYKQYHSKRWYGRFREFIKQFCR